MSLFKNSKTRVRNLMLLVLPFVIAIGIFGFLGFRSLKNIAASAGEVAASYSNSIEDMNIYLRDNATDLQKDLFKQLQEAYKGGDDQLTAELTAKCFIADFYTWTNKYGSYDVGGVYYCSDRSNVELQARDTFYHYVSYYIEKYGSENLIEVDSVNTIDAHKSSKQFYIKGMDAYYDAWTIKLNWQYADHPEFPADEYAKEMTVKVIKTERGRFEVAEAY